MQKKVPAGAVKGLFDGPPRPAPAEAPKRLPAAPAPKKQEELIEFEMIEEVVEVEEIAEVEEVEEIELALVSKKPGGRGKDREEEEEEPEVIAEMEVTYRQGVPDLNGPVAGVLVLETTGICFVVKEEEQFYLPFDKVENVLEPGKGDFPQAMKRRALGAKLGGKAGKLAAGLLGRWIGDTAGSLVEKVGKGAAGMVEGGGELGKPPRNRIVVVARLRKKRCKVQFDVHGADRDEMTAEARALYKRIQKARDKHSTAAAVEAEAQTTNINVVVNQPEPAEEEKAPPAPRRPRPGRRRWPPSLPPPRAPRPRAASPSG